MNFLQNFYSESAGQGVQISAAQGSTFAKTIAGDFNPIHDADSKRFCVPGDLLFAIALGRYGLHQRMYFGFLDLLAADKPVVYPQMETAGISQLEVVNDNGKPVLEVGCGGDVSKSPTQIEQMLRNYVAFSGQNFPHILVPLMREHQVMINPRRPLVIYESMAFEFTELEFEQLEIKLEDTSLAVNGRRGNAELHFSLNNGAQQIGSGIKKLVLSGLREYDEAAVQQLCDAYFASKEAYKP